VASSLASDLPTEFSLCQLGMEGVLDAKAVEKLFSSRDGNLLAMSFRPCREDSLLPRQAEEQLLGVQHLRAVSISDLLRGDSGR